MFSSKARLYYSGGIDNGQQVIDLALEDHSVEDAWEVLTSAGPQIVFVRFFGSPQFINPGDVVELKNKKFTVIPKVR